MAHWNLPVDDDLDKKVFEAAHNARKSKSQFIREAVIKELGRLENENVKIQRGLDNT